LVRAFVTGNGGSDLPLAGALMTFIAPESMPPDSRKSYFLRQAVQILLRKGEANAGTRASSWSLAEENRLLSIAVPLEDLQAADCRSSNQLRRPAYNYFADPSNANLIHIAIVEAKAPGKDACTMLNSLSTHY
jgi:hypothetical protein